jgi:hypothetical protein
MNSPPLKDEHAPLLVHSPQAELRRTLTHTLSSTTRVTVPSSVQTLMLI